MNVMRHKVGACLLYTSVGITLCWEGQGVDEKGIDTQTGKVLVEVDPKYFRSASDSIPAVFLLWWGRPAIVPLRQSTT